MAGKGVRTARCLTGLVQGGAGVRPSAVRPAFPRPPAPDEPRAVAFGFKLPHVVDASLPTLDPPCGRRTNRTELHGFKFDLAARRVIEACAICPDISRN